MNPVVGIVPGFGTGPQGYVPLIKALESRGMSTIFFSSLRRGGSFAGAEAYPKALAIQANQIVATIEKQDVDNLILIGQSGCGPISAIVVAMRPNLVKRLFLLCSAGIHPDTFPRLAGRFIQKIQADRKRPALLDSEEQVLQSVIWAEGLSYVNSNPFRAFAEGRAFGNFRIVDLVESSGVDAYYIGGLQDPLFTAARLATTLKHLDSHRFIKLNIGHDPQNKPEECAILIDTLMERQLLPTPYDDDAISI